MTHRAGLWAGSFLPPLLAPSQQVVGGHAEVVGQKNNRRGVDVDCPILDPLIVLLCAAEQRGHLPLCDVFFLPKWFQTIRETRQNLFHYMLTSY